MIRKSVRIVNRQGMHMRAANLFANLAGRFPASVRVSKGEVIVNGKSIMGLMMLAAPCGSEIVLEIDGDREEDAFPELLVLVRTGFGEDTEGLPREER
ncbi:MAG TPA: HPr family phosphocarrier protein [bacterium]|nr:HPr family phosphocarrier protein [bacterium]